MLRIGCFCFLMMIFSMVRSNVIEAYQFKTLEQRLLFQQLTEKLRCPQCQNQSIADSNASISEDLRNEVHALISKGYDEQQIIQFTLDRYGDFILYEPRLNMKTVLLWFGPLFLLIIALVFLVVIVKKHRLRAEHNQLDPLEKKKIDQLLGKKL